MFENTAIPSAPVVMVGDATPPPGKLIPTNAPLTIAPAASRTITRSVAVPVVVVVVPPPPPPPVLVLVLVPVVVLVLVLVLVPVVVVPVVPVVVVVPVVPVLPVVVPVVPVVVVVVVPVVPVVPVVVPVPVVVVVVVVVPVVPVVVREGSDATYSIVVPPLNVTTTSGIFPTSFREDGGYTERLYGPDARPENVNIPSTFVVPLDDPELP